MAGFGGGAIETMLVMEAFGRVLALEPYLATVVLGGTALRLAGSAAQQSAILPQIAEGRMTLAFAHGERQARYDLTDVLTTAKANARGGWVLDGAKSVVVHGDSADRLIVSARSSGERDDPDGISLFLVDASGEWRGAPLLSDARRHTGGGDLIERGRSRRRRRARRARQGIAGHRARRRGRHRRRPAAEAVGAMEAMQAMTLEYLKTRQQFGKPIGQNQALQHRSAEMLIALEQGRSMAMLAAMMVDETDAG